MTQDEIELIAEALAVVAVGSGRKPNSRVTEGLSLLLSHVARMEARVAAIEASGVKYRGVWQAAEEYRRGDMVTHDGSVFHCNDATRAKPGNGSTCWSLAVKHGRDAEPRKRFPTSVRPGVHR